MKRLSQDEIEREIAAMRDAADDGPKTWDAWFSRRGMRDVRLEFPTGELTNPAIAGFVAAWRMLGKLQLANLTPRDALDAQGLEGKVVVDRVDLSSALICAEELPRYRRALYC